VGQGPYRLADAAACRIRHRITQGRDRLRPVPMAQ
jgi:hypothetical protein